MRQARHLFERITEFSHLARAFAGARRRKRPTREVLEFAHDLEPRLWAMRAALLAGPYPWGAYRSFWIRDPKPRLIRAAPFADRVLHHAIVDALDPILRRGFIADSYACLPGRGVHRAVARFVQFARERRGLGYVLQCDIKSYFATVDHAVLNTLLARRVADERLLRLLLGLIAHGGETLAADRDTGGGRLAVGIPIGNLTSQMFANLYLDPLDHFVRERLRVRHYLRYMDDFVLLLESRDEARARLAEVETFLRERLRLRLNPRRLVIAPLACPRDVLGYVHYSSGRLRVRRRSVRRLWRRLGVLEERVRAERIPWSSVRGSVASWIGLAKHADAFHLSRAIFTARDVRNIGKRLLVRRLGGAGSRA